MKKIGFIPARYGSSRLPGKVLKTIDSLPMFVHVYKRAELSNLDEVFLLTDSRKIVDEAKKFNIKSILTSPKHENGTSRCSEGLTKIKAKKEDIFLNIQGDEPLIQPQAINEMIKYFDFKKHDILVSVTKSAESENLNTVKVVFTEDHRLLYLSRNDIPSNSESSKYITKGLSVFSYNALKRYQDLKITKLEKKENHELLRCIESGVSIYGQQIQNYGTSVDIDSDLEKVRKIMLTDKIYTQYKQI
jgi:3-deoxy-manno-octulosonate cytidylyltransferase (CMP-KDO synthetase)